MTTTKVAIIGPGNIGTDLLIKIKRLADSELETIALVGIDPESDGLARAKRLGIDAIATGVEGLIEHPRFSEIEIVFDATSAKAHEYNEKMLRPHGKILIDLTPAAVGPFVVPPVNLDEHLDAPNVYMVTCGGQATIPIVAAISQVTPVYWAEIVASISSKSAGPGTRANIDEFTETTSQAIEKIGGAARGKAIIILNPAEPPMIMRDTVLALVGEDRKDEIVASVEAMVEKVSTYVPGYKLKQEIQFTPVNETVGTLTDHTGPMWKVAVFLEVKGAAHYLPEYAGNLDIMTSAALQVGRAVAARKKEQVSA